jgi:hypothetical protein
MNADEGSKPTGGGGDEPHESDTSSQFTADLERQVVATAKSGAGREVEELLPAPLRHLPEQDHRQDIDLKRLYAKGLLLLLGGQMILADTVFVVYAWAGKQWNLAPEVINVWLGATVVQLIGVVLVVTRYLFPRRDGRL